jgi:mannosyltransferase OCH1-like enzyme
MTLLALSSLQMSFSRDVGFLCNPVRSALVFCFISLSMILYVTYTYRTGEALLQSYFLSPEDITVWGRMCRDGEDPTASLCPPAAGDYPEERILRIIHQTYKTADNPENWVIPYESCKEIHQGGNRTFVLWTDEDSAKFIAAKYPWFLDTCSDYPYAIQRADAIRYFIIHHYGGFYLDLDVGCRKDLSPLLKYDAIFLR